ncbi:MAG: hypothetical protein JRI97_01015 [Deltaproteobacteria bacterium]|nr:hypothetical protein [Deltaproteobacteria bacterium]
MKAKRTEKQGGQVKDAPQVTDDQVRTALCELFLSEIKGVRPGTCG